MACGMPLGFTLGFAFVAHQRVRAGWRPRTRNRFLLMFFGCAEPRTSREMLHFWAGTFGLVATFFLVSALPFMVALALPGDSRSLGAPIAAAFAFAGLIGQSFGAKLCLRFVRAF
jgi:hypothetical protein